MKNRIGMTLEEKRLENVLTIGDDSLALNAKIYRVFNFEHLRRMLREKNNVLVKPKKWDDPFDNFLMKTEIEESDGSLGTLERIMDNFYGQCWSLSGESDATWRIYAANKDAKQNEGIMVSSTVEKLFFSLYDLHDEAPYLKYFVGKMTYMEEQELKQWLSNTDGYYLFDSLGVGLTKTLLIKRMAFQHENEVRLIFNAPTERPAVTSRENWGEELYVYNTNPKNIFDEYLIDPRLADGEVEDIRKTLLSSGVPKASVSQSSLYKSPKLRMKMLHR